MQGYHIEAQKLIADLESIKNIEIQQLMGLRSWEFNKEVIEFAIKSSLRRENFKFPDELNELHIMPSSSLFWILNENDPKLNVTGNFNLKNIFESAILNSSNIEGYNDVFEEREVSHETREQFRKSRYIDYVESFGYAAIMKEDNNTWDLNDIWFMEEEALEFRKMDIDLRTYMETVLTLKGAYYWQYLFFNKEYLIEGFDSYYMEHICRWIVKLPELWPNHNYSKVVERFKSIADKQLSNTENALYDILKNTLQRLKEMKLIS